jgi:hypothetical protein
MMEAARTSETSVDFQLRTWQYIPEDFELHTRRREISQNKKAPFFSCVILVLCIFKDTSCERVMQLKYCHLP